MIDATDIEGGLPSQCQAQPAVTRHGWRTDLLCASSGNSIVRFRGADVAVCRIHEKAYARWGLDAEGNATLYWGWPHGGPTGMHG